MFEPILDLIPEYRLWAWNDYAFHAIWGVAGAFLRLAYSNAPLKKWEYTKDGLRLHAVGEWFTAFVIGTLANTNPLISVVSAWLAPSLMEEAERILEEGFRYRLRRWVLGDVSVAEVREQEDNESDTE